MKHPVGNRLWIGGFGSSNPLFPPTQNRYGPPVLRGQQHSLRRVRGSSSQHHHATGTDRGCRFG